jgi:hypothetical protein
MERMIALVRATSSGMAVAALIVVNLLPLAGVLWWGWDLWTILVLYWVENGIVGVFNVLKMLRAEGTAVPGMRGVRFNGRPLESVARGPLAAFFVMHYGIFWAVHGLFVLTFLPLITGISLDPRVVINPDGSVGVPFELFRGVGPDWGLVGIGAIGMALSHGASFAFNFLGRGEYRSVSAGQLMLAPYGRLVVLHMTIILGAMVSAWVGAPVGAMIVLVVLKTALDLFFHLREHARIPARAATGTP